MEANRWHGMWRCPTRIVSPTLSIQPPSQMQQPIMQYRTRWTSASGWPALIFSSFYPVAIGTAGTWHDMAIARIGRRIITVTDENGETAFLYSNACLPLSRKGTPSPFKTPYGHRMKRRCNHWYFVFNCIFQFSCLRLCTGGPKNNSNNWKSVVPVCDVADK